MKDEIKEILEDIKEIYYFKPLLDYITNLQQENERLKKLVDKDYTELNIAEMKATICKSRIDKAIEYIHSEEYWYSQVESEKKLLEILEGNENK